MVKGYVFISNSNKPTPEVRASREPVPINNFSRLPLEVAAEMGYTVHLGVNRDRPAELESIPSFPSGQVRFYDSSTYRNPFAVRDNLRALRNLVTLLRGGNFEVVHCNTPIGGLVGRVGARIARVPTVIYTVHGFHFYRGGPRLQNALYRVIESMLARWTDAIITINSEDFEAAQRFRLRKGGRVFQVPGVGIDLDLYRLPDLDASTVRKALGVPPEAFMLVSAGDLVARKDFATAVRSISLVRDPSVHLVICGDGPELGALQTLVSGLGVEGRVHFLGRRQDIPEILAASDALLLTSRQEGLARAVMEAMAAGRPCVVSEIRGNVDLIEHGVGGFLCEVGDADAFARAVERLASDDSLAKCMGAENRRRAENYSVDRVRSALTDVYQTVLSR